MENKQKHQLIQKYVDISIQNCYILLINIRRMMSYCICVAHGQAHCRISRRTSYDSYRPMNVNETTRKEERERKRTYDEEENSETAGAFNGTGDDGNGTWRMWKF